MEIRDKSDRYQYQPWYVKLWRRRHYIPIPWIALRIYVHNRIARSYDPLSWHNAQSIAIGLAQVKMNWLHDWADIRRKTK